MGTIDVAALNRIVNSPTGPVGKQVLKISNRIAIEASTIADAELGKNPRDKTRTGDYAKGFYVKKSGNRGGYSVKNDKNYSFILERGSRSHLIRARRARKLVFIDRQGRQRIEDVVPHPGTPAYRILERAAKRTVKRS